MSPIPSAIPGGNHELALAISAISPITATTTNGSLSNDLQSDSPAWPTEAH